MSGEIELVAFLSNLNYAVELQSENLADAKTEAARHITGATAKVTIYRVARKTSSFRARMNSATAKPF